MASQTIDTDIIKEGDSIIVQFDKISRLVDLEKRKPQYFVKRKINLSNAVGFPYGSCFKVNSDGTLQIVSNSESINHFNFTECPRENSEIVPDPKDNRTLFDSGESQKLTTDDIETLKASGITGEEVVQKIIENSTSFNDKTAFAKEKYLKKKQKKYMKCLRILKPNLRLLAEMHYTQGPLKISNLRIDTLSQMLNICNVCSGGKYMVVEAVMDLLVTAVLDKLGGDGCVVQLHMKPFSIKPTRRLLDTLRLTEMQLKSIFHNIDIQSAFSLLRDSDEEKMIVDTADDAMDHTSDADTSTPRTEKKVHIDETKEILKMKNMDGLLVAVKTHPANVLPLLDFLSISRPFAIFSMYQEPLVDCYVRLKSRGDIILLNISDTWLRYFQVMTERTHPLYTMSGHGGYLLTGFKVAPKPRN